jgi:hypothetical protein
MPPEGERMDRSGADILCFEDFRFDRRSGGCLHRLNQADASDLVVLGRRTLRLLSILVEHPGEKARGLVDRSPG